MWPEAPLREGKEGMLSPLLWNIVINSLLIALVAPVKFESVLRDLIQDALNYNTRCAKSCGLGVNPGKKELVLFTRNTQYQTFLSKD